MRNYSGSRTGPWELKLALQIKDARSGDRKHVVFEEDIQLTGWHGGKVRLRSLATRAIQKVVDGDHFVVAVYRGLKKSGSHSDLSPREVSQNSSVRPVREERLMLKTGIIDIAPLQAQNYSSKNPPHFSAEAIDLADRIRAKARSRDENSAVHSAKRRKPNVKNSEVVVSGKTVRAINVTGKRIRSINID